MKQMDQNQNTKAIVNQPPKPKLKTLVIPFVIKQIYPGLTLAEYQKIKEDRTFLNSTTFVCEDCYLCISMSSEASGVRIIIPPKPISKAIKVLQKPRLAVEKKQNMDLLASRNDIKQKDARADTLTKKYSHKALAAS